MNLMFITPGMIYGGAERVISILSNEWIKLGINVTIVITSEETSCVYSLSDKIELVYLNGLNKDKFLPHLDLIKRLRKLIKEKNPDKIISFMNDTCAYTIISTIGLNIPIFYSERNDPNNVNQDIKNKIFKKIVEICAKGIVFQTEGAKLYYSKKVQKKSKVILNPMNLENLPLCSHLERKKEIVTIGRLENQKNQSLLIKAFSIIYKKYPDYVLKIYGKGSLKEKLLKLIKELKLEDKVYLMGNSKNVLNEIKDSSLFVLSSDYEGLPNALMEAMVIGLPCISTDCSPGGARMFIEDGKNGYIVPCNNKEELIKAMDKVLASRLIAKKIGEEAKKLKDNVKSEIIAKQWLDFLELNIKDKKNETK